MSELHRILTLLEQAGLGKYRAVFEPMIKTSIRLISSPAEDDDIPVGSTKLGGCPDVTDGFVWPTWGDTYLSFLAQVNLSKLDQSALADHGCPTEGLLSFFYAPDAMFDIYDNGSSVQVYYCDAQELSRIAIPDQVPEQWRFSVCSLKDKLEWTVPDSETYEIQKILGMGWSNNREDFDLYWETFLPKVSTEFIQEEHPRHRLLGNHDAVQSGYVAGGYSLLLQIDSDDAAHMMWGDVGKLYFWIKPEQLRNKQFSAVFVTMECT